MIKDAQERLKGVAQKTGLSYKQFRQRSGCEVYLKLENLQRTGSFNCAVPITKSHP